MISNKDSNNKKKYVRYFCTNSFGFGWGKTPLDAWHKNSHTGLRDKVDCYLLAESHIYEITSTIKPDAINPTNWEIEISRDSVRSNNSDVNITYMWTDRLVNYKKKSDDYHRSKLSFCTQDQEWKDNPVHIGC